MQKIPINIFKNSRMKRNESKLMEITDLHFGVGVVDDGQEHVEQDEENEEDVREEHNRTQNSVGRLQRVEVEVTQDNSEQGEAARQQSGIEI